MYVFKFRFKILVIGDVGVGKTTFDTTYGYRGFSTNYRSTIGASFNVVDMNVQDCKVKLLFWVLSDDVGFRFVHTSFVQNAMGAILLYDITNASSMTGFPYWLDLITVQYDDLPMMLAGNKLDLPEQQVISREEGLAFQREHNLTEFMEVSMKTGEGVYEMFKYLRDFLLEKCLHLYWSEGDP